MQFLINDCSCDLAVHVGVLLPFWSIGSGQFTVAVGENHQDTGREKLSFCVFCNRLDFE